MAPSRKIIVGGVLAAVFLLVPIPYLASPEWHVRVVDRSGIPLQGMVVRMSYQNSSVEPSGHEEDEKSDERGEAVFPKHTRWASTLQRIIFTAHSATALAHAGFGSHAYVFAFGNGLEGGAVSGNIVTDWTGRPARMESQIVATPVAK